SDTKARCSRRGRLSRTFPRPLEVPILRMNTSLVPLRTLQELRQHVLETLCGHDCLDASRTPLHESVVRRSGRPCGLFFHVEGPRLLKSYAVWAADEHRVLFYDGAGSRFAETRLSGGPDWRELAA